MKNNQSGFAFLPAILIIGLLIVGGGAGALITKKVHDTPSVPNLNTAEQNNAGNLIEEKTDENLNKSSQDTDGANSQDDLSQNEIEQPVIGQESQSIVQEPVTSGAVVQKVTEVKQLTQKDIESSVVEEVLTMSDSQEIVSAHSDNTYDETESDEISKMAYDRVGVASKNLSEGIVFVEERYAELISFRDRGLELCETRYKNDQSSVKAEAESLKTTYAESRTGYATQPSMSSDIDRALNIELARIEDNYVSCKEQYEPVDESIERDIKSIKSEQSSIRMKLTIDNAVSSLEKMLALQGRLIKVTDKF